MALVQVALVQQKLLSRLTRLWILLIIVIPTRLMAKPVVPQFRSGSQTTSSTSQSVINETITSYQYRTGYSYAASGHNIKATLDSINPTATTQTSQTVGGVNFSWTSPNLESIPRWQIVSEGAAFSIQETLITPGLDTVTNITRTITTSQTSETTSTFGQ